MNFYKKLCYAFFFVFLLGRWAFADSQSFIYDDKGRRDPFWPLVSSSGTIVTYDQDLVFSDLILEGITYDAAGKSVAVINSSIVSINDKIGGYQVAEIRRLVVVLSKEGKTYILKMKKER